MLRIYRNLSRHSAGGDATLPVKTVEQLEFAGDEIVGDGRSERRCSRLVTAGLVGVGEREVAAAAVGKTGQKRNLERRLFFDALADVVERLARETAERDRFADRDPVERKIVEIGVFRHIDDTARARDLGRQLHALPRKFGILARLMHRPDFLGPGEILLVRVLRLVGGNADLPHGETDFAGFKRNALHPDRKRAAGENVGHMPGVIVSAVDIVEVALKPVAFARTRHDVDVIDVALRTVEDDAAGLAHGRRLEHRARKPGPVGGKSLVADYIGMRLEIDDADGLVALAVDAQNLNFLVGGRTVRLVDIGVVDAGILPSFMR